MRVSGSIGGVSLSSLAQRAILPSRRLPHIVTAIGDSRVAAIWSDNANSDENRRIRSSNSPLNMANALLGHRLVVGKTFGISGDRTDQVLVRLPLALSTRAGVIYIQCGLNDIAQDYPTAATSAATAFANIRTMAESARAAGMLVVIELEVGSNSISATQVQQLVELNALLYEYAETTPAIHLHDARPVMLNQAYSSTLISFKPGYAYDGVHVNGRGALYWGESLSALLQQIVPPRAGLLAVNTYELMATGRRQMLANHAFTATTGGTSGTGFTGSAPANWTTTRGGSATCALSSAAKANGFGSEVTLDCSFTAAGEFCRIYQDVAGTANWNSGEVYEAFAKVRINGTPAALGRVRLQGQCNSTPSGSQDFMAGEQDNSWLGPDHAATLTLVTRPYVVPALTGKGWLTCSLNVMASGAGTASVTIEQIGLRRRNGAY